MTDRDWKVLLLGSIHECCGERLEAAGGFGVVKRPDGAPDLVEAVADVDAIIVRLYPMDERLIAAAPNLKLMARHGVGYDTVDVDALTRRGIPLSVVGDVNSGAVAEHTLAMMLGLAKRLVSYDAATRAGDFAIRDSFGAGELAGKTVAVIGFGRIGQAVARLASAFSMRVVVHDPGVQADVIAATGASPAETFAEAIGQADWVTLHLPKTPQTVNLINAETIAAMKPGAYLVNAARGGLIDEAALVAALDSGQLAGAALDVFEREPFASEDRLAGRRDVLLSPHSAASTLECVKRMATASADAVIAFREGRLDPSLIVNRVALGG